MAKSKGASSGLVIGIDGTNLRQGGGITHLVELLRVAKPEQDGIAKVVVWSNTATLSAIEERPWLKKINPSELERGLVPRIFWQRFTLSKELNELGCDLLFVPGGSFSGSFKPFVTMSRNMLPFEMHELMRFGWSLTTLRFLLLRQWQSRTFRRADGVIFLTRYAKESVSKIVGSLKGKTHIIPHGISTRFQRTPKPQWSITEYDSNNPFRLIYVSIINQYKHQWHVVEAVASLRQAGFPIELDLIGPSFPMSEFRFEESRSRWDPSRSWVKYNGEISYEALHHKYAQADLGLFASSCENMPNILLETMASGLPVACSNRGPMPEVLGNAGVYFDPEQPADITRALRELINSPQLRSEKAKASYERSLQYTWHDCADSTMTFLAEIARQQKSFELYGDESGISIGIDASRNRSGGAKAHLIGILSEGDPIRFGISKVHVWAYGSLLASLPEHKWLVKHNPPELEQSLLTQLWWQRFRFADEANEAGCQIVLNTDAGTVSKFRPAVTMSRDMLSYEPGAMERFGFSRARLRLILLRFIQNRSLRNADGSIFLTRYAAKVIQQSCGLLPSISCIPHGVGAEFKQAVRANDWPQEGERPVRCVYVSNASMYKHQWMVVRAVASLRKQGHNVTLSLVGGGTGPAKQLLLDEIAVSDPDGIFVQQVDFVPQKELPLILADADLFVFASSCENMPNTLLEAMAVGLPIACSNRGPMPEVLADAGVYFDPEDADSIASAIAQLMQIPALRSEVSRRAKSLSEQYSWGRCADETWAFLSKTLTGIKDNIQNSRPYQVCTTCVMDTSDTVIVFDEKGVCDHCNTFYTHTLPNWHTDERGAIELQGLIEKIKLDGKGKDFDCIVGMSGGIDSSYLTYLAKAEFGLRPLVFHVDAGWNSQEAVNNIEKLVDGLGLDLYTEVIDWDEMRDLQLAFFKSGVPHIDAPQDNAFFATMYKFAQRYKVNYILTGANLSTEGIRNPVEWMYYQSDATQLQDIHRRYGIRPLVNYPLTSILWHKIYLPFIKGIKVVRPLNYVSYVKQDAMKFLIEKFGWQPYPQKHFESRFTRFYESYWLPKRFGYDVRRVQYSSLILTGQMTRQEALENLNALSYDESTIAYDIEYIANKLGVTVKELNSYMELPKRSYRDFKSQRQIYDIGARVMKTIGWEVGGKR